MSQLIQLRMLLLQQFLDIEDDNLAAITKIVTRLAKNRDRNSVRRNAVVAGLMYNK